MPKQINAALNYWERESFFDSIDIAIIGSGIVGLNAAITIKEQRPNANVVVFERGVLPIGASTRNAGFACFGSLTELLDDLEHHSEDEVLSLVAKRWAGLHRLRTRLGDTAIRYKEYGGFELFRASEEKAFQQCADHISYFNKKIEAIIGHDEVYKIVDEKIPSLGFDTIVHLIANQAEGQIHTGEMMANLLALARSKGIHILNGLAVDQLEDAANGVYLQMQNGWSIRVAKVLVATNGFVKRLLKTIPTVPARNQVLITKPIANLKLQGCYHYDKGYFYFRNIDHRILLGGGRNLAKVEEEIDEFGTTDKIQKALIDLLQTVILPHQKVEVDCWWSGILGVGNQKKPIVEMVSENVGISVRLGGMGVAIGSLIGEEGANLILKS